jgi:hypothetical protein
MAILRAGNTELEIKYHKYYPDQNWSDISFALRHSGLSLINPRLYGKNTENEMFIDWNVWEDELLIPFFEKVLYKRENAAWDLFPEDCIRMKAETLEGTREERESKYKGKTCMEQGEDGVTREVPYSEAVKLFEGLFEDYFDLHISIADTYLAGEYAGLEGVKITISMKLSFHSLEGFLQELKAEHRLFQLLKLKSQTN